MKRPIRKTIYYSRLHDGECYYVDDVWDMKEDGEDFFIVSLVDWNEDFQDEDDVDDVDLFCSAWELTPEEWEIFRTGEQLITREEITCFDTYWHKKFNG